MWTEQPATTSSTGNHHEPVSVGHLASSGDIVSQGWIKGGVHDELQSGPFTPSCLFSPFPCLEETVLSPDILG